MEDLKVMIGNAENPVGEVWGRGYQCACHRLLPLLLLLLLLLLMPLEDHRNATWAGGTL